MAFGWSATDIAALAKLAYTTVQNCRKACGEYDDLTRQVQSLRGVIRNLRDEAADAKSLLHRPGRESCWEGLQPNLEGSQEVLRGLNVVLVKYASINRKDRTIGRLWTRAKFGNKELGTLNDLRQKAKFYTGAISTMLSTAAVGSLGRIEQSLDEAGLRDIKPAIEVIVGKLTSMGHGDGSVLTAYANDDRAVWKELRRELVKENIAPSNIISKNKDLITQFIRELGERGDFDDLETHAQDAEGISRDVVEMQHNPEAEFGSEDDTSNSEAAWDSEEDKSTNGKGFATSQHPPSVAKSQKYATNESHHHSSPDESEDSKDSLQESQLEHLSSQRKISSSRGGEELPKSDGYPAEDDGYHRGKRSSNHLSSSSSHDLEGSLDSDGPSTGPIKDKVSNDENPGPQSTKSQSHTQTTGLADHEKRRLEMSHELSIENMLMMDLEHRIPESMKNFSLFQREHPHYHRLTGYRARVFYATPWGPYLSVGRANLSLITEDFKFVFSLLEYCISGVKTAPTLAERALFNGGFRYDAVEITEQLQFKINDFAARIKVLAASCTHEMYLLPTLSDSPDEAQIWMFCDGLRQRMYHHWQLLRRSDMSTAWLDHETDCFQAILSEMVRYLNIVKSFGDKIRFLMSQINPTRTGHGQVNQWTQQCTYDPKLESLKHIVEDTEHYLLISKLESKPEIV